MIIVQIAEDETWQPSVAILVILQMKETVLGKGMIVKKTQELKIFHL